MLERTPASAYLDTQVNIITVSIVIVSIIIIIIIVVWNGHARFGHVKYSTEFFIVFFGDFSAFLALCVDYSHELRLAVSRGVLCLVLCRHLVGISAFIRFAACCPSPSRPLAVCLHGTGPLHVSSFRPLYSFNPIVFDATVAHLAAVPGRE